MALCFVHQRKWDHCLGDPCPECLNDASIRLARQLYSHAYGDLPRWDEGRTIKEQNRFRQLVMWSDRFLGYEHRRGCVAIDGEQTLAEERRILATAIERLAYAAIRAIDEEDFEPQVHEDLRGPRVKDLPPSLEWSPCGDCDKDKTSEEG